MIPGTVASPEFTMFTVTRLENTPPDSIDSQIMQMVVDYVTDISMVGIAPSNPLYPLYHTALVMRCINTFRP